MSQGNNVNIVGNCIATPELRFTPSGQAVATFGVAVNRRWKVRGSDEWSEAVSFFDVTCWGTLGENVAESVQKGTRVIVEGRLEQRGVAETFYLGTQHVRVGGNIELGVVGCEIRRRNPFKLNPAKFGKVVVDHHVFGDRFGRWDGKCHGLFRSRQGPKPFRNQLFGSGDIEVT